MSNMGKTINNAPFPVGTKVIDRDGHKGTVTKITVWEGSRWYDVRFGRAGEAVRFDGDLKKDNT